jgi:hypothetical protein
MRVSFLLPVLVACTLCIPVARAQEPDYDRFITQALAAYDAGRWTEARTLFRRAHQLQPTARTFRTLGMCSFNLGDYVDALQNLETALVDPRKPLTPEQRAHVAGLIERSNQEIGRFRLQLTPENAVLFVGGAPAELLARRELLLESGRHVITASADGYRASQRELTVERGDRATLEFRLEPLAAAEPLAATAPPAVTPLPATAPPPAATIPVAPIAERPSRRESGTHSTQSVLGFVGVGLGAAGVATFAVAGGLALAKKATLEGECPNRTCGPDHHGDVDTYDRLKTLSTVGLVAGAGLLSIGAVLLFTGAHESPPARAAALEPELGLGWAGVRGQL